MSKIKVDGIELLGTENPGDSEKFKAISKDIKERSITPESFMEANYEDNLSTPIFTERYAIKENGVVINEVTRFGINIFSPKVTFDAYISRSGDGGGGGGGDGSASSAPTPSPEEGGSARSRASSMKSDRIERYSANVIHTKIEARALEEAINYLLSDPTKKQY